MCDKQSNSSYSISEPSSPKSARGPRKFYSVRQRRNHLLDDYSNIARNNFENMQNRYATDMYSFLDKDFRETVRLMKFHKTKLTVAKKEDKKFKDNHVIEQVAARKRAHELLFESSKKLGELVSLPQRKPLKPERPITPRRKPLYYWG